MDSRKSSRWGQMGPGRMAEFEAEQVRAGRVSSRQEKKTKDGVNRMGDCVKEWWVGYVFLEGEWWTVNDER